MRIVLSVTNVLDIRGTIFNSVGLIIVLVIFSVTVDSFNMA